MCVREGTPQGWCPLTCVTMPRPALPSTHYHARGSEHSSALHLGSSLIQVSAHHESGSRNTAANKRQDPCKELTLQGTESGDKVGQ